jgi:hypothetical protein
MNYSSRDDSDFADMPDYRFYDLSLHERRVSSATIMASESGPYGALSQEIRAGLDLIKTQRPEIPEDFICVEHRRDVGFENLVFYIRLAKHD